MTDPSAPIVKTIVIEAAPAEVWQVLTTPAMIRQWMSDEELTVRLEGHAGGAIVIRGLLHGMRFENYATVRAFEPERLFSYSYWSTLSASRLADVARKPYAGPFRPGAGGSGNAADADDLRLRRTGDPPACQSLLGPDLADPEGGVRASLTKTPRSEPSLYPFGRRAKARMRSATLLSIGL